MDTTDANTPVVFMDFDGVLNYFTSKNQYRKYGDTLGYLCRVDVPVGAFWYRLNWSAELVRKLMILKAENPYKWVWLTTWAPYTSMLDAKLEITSDSTADWDPDNPNPEGYKTPLSGSDLSEYRNNTKLSIVLDFAANNPDTPFAWVDDEATALWTEEHALSMTAPFLVLKTSETYGMVQHDLTKLENFVRANSN